MTAFSKQSPIEPIETLSSESRLGTVRNFV